MGINYSGRMIVGIQTPNNIDFESLDNWVADIKPLFTKVEKLTGIKPNLIGTQDIY